ncbi:histone-lysine N-methyltransferase SETMAR [Trichonephila clavipes]|nr:histone-lysine N-methyltransferase SETMAR [Trichonephila clavipes]
MTDNKVQKWVRKFNDGRTNVHDEECSGRSTLITEYLMQAVETKIRDNRRFTITTLSFPTLLTLEHKEKRFVTSLGILIRYEEEGDDMLSRIITGDEAGVFHINPESKQHSMEWQHRSSLVKVKAKQTLSKRKTMATMFWDRRGDLLVDFRPKETTISSSAY